MRLYAESVHLPYDEMPAPMQAVVLSEEEQQLSDSDKKELAHSYVFGSSYTTVKDDINQNIFTFKEYIVQRNDAEVKQAAQRTYDSLILTQVFHAVSMLIFILTMGIFYVYAIKPFRRYNKDLNALYHKEGSPLKASGTKEMREFANRFNALYEDWKIQNENLQKLNAIDPLTQLADRRTLDAYIHELMDGQAQSMGLLMIDIDSFI